MVAVAVEGKVHIIGGRYSVGDEDMTGVHEIYDPATDIIHRWATAADTAGRRGRCTVPGHGPRLWGAEDGVRTFDENEAYDVKADRGSS